MSKALEKKTYEIFLIFDFFVDLFEQSVRDFF